MTATTRHTAGERREDVLAVAVEEFARAGFHGASTEVIARRAGISQPYLFRLFGSKKDLHLAAVRRCFLRTLERMQAAAEGLRGEAALEAIGEAYIQLLSSDQTMLQGQLQAYAAAVEDADVRDAVRDGYGDIWTYLEHVSGASAQRLAAFHATGMLLNVIAAMGFSEEEDLEPWAQRLVAGCTEPEPEPGAV